jgi:hypothetical protein
MKVCPSPVGIWVSIILFLPPTEFCKHTMGPFQTQPIFIINESITVVETYPTTNAFQPFRLKLLLPMHNSFVGSTVRGVTAMYLLQQVHTT